MNVTINTDASFSNKHKVGTFAYWIVSNLGRLKGSGVLKHECHDASDAEMKAICNAMAIMTMYPELMQKVKRLYINTDSMNAIHVFNSNEDAIRRYHIAKKKYKSARKKYHNIRSKHFKHVEFIFAHVKAHTGIQDSRSVVNEWLDQHAKMELKQVLDKKEKNEQKGS